MSAAEEPTRQAPTHPTTLVATLDDVDIRRELSARPRRGPNLEREHRALLALAAEMANRPRNMLQKLAELAIELCASHTAGISVLEGAVIRWTAVAGVLAPARGATVPRDASPDGVCIDRDATQLMYLADRCFPALLTEPRFVEVLLVPFHHDGKPIGTVWLASHTEDWKFDKEDERIVRELSHFASAGWQLLHTAETLEQNARRKNGLLATFGHELRNPIGAIAAATSVLQHRNVTGEAAAHAMDIIARQSRHMARLVDEALDISRIESGQLQLNRRTVDLRTVVAEIVEAHGPQIARRRHALTVDLGNRPILIEADPARLAQVVSKLVDNAATYTPPEGTVSVALVPQGDQVEVIVTDSGVGIPPERANLIFEPFAEAEQTPNTSIGGLGLGLALVKRLAELHGGAVDVISPGPGQGSSFKVRLPFHSEQLNG